MAEPGAGNVFLSRAIKNRFGEAEPDLPVMGIDRAAAHPASLFVHIPTLAHRAERAVLCRGQSIRRDRCGLAGTCRYAADGVVGCWQRRTTVVAVIRHAPGGTVIGLGEGVAVGEAYPDRFCLVRGWPSGPADGGW